MPAVCAFTPARAEGETKQRGRPEDLRTACSLPWLHFQFSLCLAQTPECVGDASPLGLKETDKNDSRTLPSDFSAEQRPETAGHSRPGNAVRLFSGPPAVPGTESDTSWRVGEMQPWPSDSFPSEGGAASLAREAQVLLFWTARSHRGCDTLRTGPGLKKQEQSHAHR